jgi:formate dehydrogenase gamma subunit
MTGPRHTYSSIRDALPGRLIHEEVAMRTKFKRFSASRIIEHWVHLANFSILVSTGLSQKFYTLDIARWFILQMGGIDNVRIIHRYTGILFSLAIAAHVLTAIVGVVVKKWQPSMVITKNDFLSVVHNIRYYLGSEAHPAAGGKYNYTQKFEYWGILTGAFLMICSGAVLWNPLFVTRFMSGEIIPAAKVMHTNEAMVVFVIIVLWHIYNAVFSPEVFPLNMSIFTGSISRERMLHEHIIELAAIEKTTVEELRAHYDEEPPQEQ